MIERDFVKARPPGAAPARTDADPASAARIAAELDEIVSRSGRPSHWRRALRRVGEALAHRLDQLVPPAPVSDDPGPPQIRFPFF